MGSSRVPSPDSGLSAAAVGGLCLAVGVLAGVAAVRAPLLILPLILAAPLLWALRQPPVAWVLTALVLVMLIRIPTSVGVLPEAAVQLPIFVGWTAFGLALFRYPRVARGLPSLYTLLLFLFVASVVLAGISAGSSLLRGPFYLALIGTPLAIIGALLLDPPDALWRRRLVMTTLVLLLVQIPVMLGQTVRFGTGDFVTGTLAGSLIGAHQVAAIAIIGALWLALSRPRSRWMWAAVGLLAIAPMLSAANQVILSLPATLLAAVLVSKIKIPIRPLLAVGGVFVLLLALPGWNSDYARTVLKNAGTLIKAEPATAIAAEMRDDQRVLLFGQGPASSVSGAAILTADQSNKQIETIGISPADFPQQLDTFGEESSVRGPISSLLGLPGDLGLLGTVTYLAVFALIFNRTRKVATPLGQATTAALVLLLMLGFFNDGLEQPPFALFTAILVGLTLTSSSGPITGRRVSSLRQL